MRGRSASPIFEEGKRESIVVDGHVEKEKEHNGEHNEQQLVRPHIQVYKMKRCQISLS